MVTKREEVGFGWASIVNSYLDNFPGKLREDYMKRFTRTLKEYKFYSQNEENKKNNILHPRSVKRKSPELRSYDINNPKNFAIFVAKQLEEGLVAETSKRKREHLLKHLID